MGSSPRAYGYAVLSSPALRGGWRRFSRSPGWSSPWRFTIRELILLTAAVAGFLAWANLAYQRSRPYQRTAIPHLVGNFRDIANICRSLGHKSASYSSGGGGSAGMHATTRSYDSHIDLPLKLRGQFMQAFRQYVLTLLQKHAKSVSGAGSTSDASGLAAFDFLYVMFRGEPSSNT